MNINFKGNLLGLGSALNSHDTAKQSRPTADLGTPSVSNPSAESHTASNTTVQLTTQAKVAQRAEKAMADIPIVNQARVDSLKQAIREGSYALDPKRIAAKILATESELPLPKE